jgi:hypothetical protein
MVFITLYDGTRLSKAIDWWFIIRAKIAGTCSSARSGFARNGPNTFDDSVFVFGIETIHIVRTLAEFATFPNGAIISHVATAGARTTIIGDANVASAFLMVSSSIKHQRVTTPAIIRQARSHKRCLAGTLCVTSRAGLY